MKVCSGGVGLGTYTHGNCSWENDVHGSLNGGYGNVFCYTEKACKDCKMYAIMKQHRDSQAMDTVISSIGSLH